METTKCLIPLVLTLPFEAILRLLTGNQKWRREIVLAMHMLSLPMHLSKRIKDYEVARVAEQSIETLPSFLALGVHAAMAVCRGIPISAAHVEQVLHNEHKLTEATCHMTCSFALQVQRRRTVNNAIHGRLGCS